jgi:hypothetical protein
VPIGRLSFQVTPARPREGVDLGTTLVLSDYPFSRDPALLLQLVQRGIQRTIAHLECLVRHLVEALTDGPPIERLKGQDFQDQEVQCPLDQIGWFTHIDLGNRG